MKNDRSGVVSRFMAALAAVPLLLLIATQAYAGHQGDPLNFPHGASAPAQPSTVLIVDAGVQDAEVLLSGVSPDARIVRLSGDSDGVQQVAAALKDSRNLDSIQIISHGAPGRLALGSTVLSDANLDRYRSALQGWGRALKAGGDIQFYGCNVAQGKAGDRFVNRIGAFIGAPVAASTDATGAESLGGNWLLEKRTGQITAKNAIAAQAMLGYGRLLVLPANGVQDVTNLMIPPTTTFVPGFTFTDNTGSGFLGDPGTGGVGNGIYPNNNTANTSYTYTVNADGVNLGSFDLTAINFTNFGNLYNYSFTITGTKVGGAQVTTTATFNGPTYTPGNYTTFTGIKSFQITYVGSGGGGPGNITFDYFSIANAAAPAPAPTFGTITPATGPTTGGTSVAITGTNFVAPASVTIGGVAATGVTVVSATQINAVTPSNAAGIVAVAVTTPGGTATGTGVFTYTAVAPVVSSISPTSGPATGGTAVTITGTSFTGATSVTIGGVAATNVVIKSDTQITANTPQSNTAGTVAVAVITAAGMGSANVFSYNATAPGAPTNIAATAGNASATVTFTAPTFTGGSAITTYTATSSPGGLTGSCTGPSACTITVPSLTNGTAYTFTVTATNAIGTGAPSAVSNSVTPATVPGMPTGVSATGLNGSATVTFTAPVSNGGSAITSYTATSSPGGLTGSCTGSAACTITVNGLTNGTPYTFTVTATNAIGTGAPSAVSNSVTPATVPGMPTGVSATGLNGSATVTFTAPVSNGGSAITSYTATSSPGGLTGSCTGSAACTITVNGLTNGTPYTFTVTATNAVGTSVASVASSSVTPQAPQTITFGAPPVILVGGSGTVSATASSGLTVTYSSTTLSVCTITGTTVTGIAAGTCIIAANQAGNTTYLAAPQVTQNISVGLNSQTITFGAPPTVAVGGSGTVSATASSGLTVTYSSTTLSVCTITGTTVNSIAVGTCTIAANQAGNGTYAPAPQVTQNISVGQASQTITFGTAPAVAVGGTGTVSATASSGLTVTYSSTTPSVCTITGTTVAGVAAGTCTIAATQAGNTTYLAAAQVTQNIAVGKGSQTITFGAAPTVVVAGAGTLSATASSGLAVSFTSTTPSVCTVTGSTVKGVAAGACTIAANQAGNTNYTAAAQVTQNITVGQGSQTIAFGAAPTVLTGGTGTLSATATSGLAVTFTSTTTATCTVAGSTVTGVAAGTCVVAASQAGNANYAAAPQVTQTIVVGTRPDPTQDAAVVGLVNAQMLTAIRFRDAQMFNFQQRLESRHHATQPLQASGFAASTRAVGLAGGSDAFGDAPASAGSQPANAAAGGDRASANLLQLASAGRSGGAGQPGGAQAATGPAWLASSLMSVVTTSSVNLDLGTLSRSMLGDSPAAADGSGLEVWGAGNVRFGSRNQPTGGAGIDFTTAGATVGVDKRIGDQLTLGVGVGYARDNSSIGSDGTGSHATGNSVAAYASYQATSAVFVDGLLGYGSLGFDTTRYVAAVNSLAVANRTGNQSWGSLAAGYEYRDQGMVLSPYARYNLGYDQLNAATESGAGAFSLNYASQTTKSQQVSLGFRAEDQVQTDWGVAMPRGRIEYQHAIQGATQTSLAYADLISSRYNLTMPGTSVNSWLLGVGSGLALQNNWHLDGEYQRQRSLGGGNLQAVSVRLSRSW